MIATAKISAKRTPTTEMQVTSIRLETDLKEKLKGLSGNQGYQSLIRDILWDYVERNARSSRNCLSLEDIRATMPATAQREEICAISGQKIAVHSPLFLGLTLSGEMVPISADCL